MIEILRNSLVAGIVLALLTAGFAAVPADSSAEDAPASPEIVNVEVPEAPEPVDEDALATVRLPFIKNVGQLDPQVRYYANTFAGPVFVTDAGLTYDLIVDPAGETGEGRSLALGEHFSTDAVLQPAEGQMCEAVVNYFIGPQDQWQSDVPSFDSVYFDDVWPGVRVELSAYGNNLEKIFEVSPGGIAGDIRMEFDGVGQMVVDTRGDLVISTIAGPLTMTAPVGYQLSGDERTPVDVWYTVDGGAYGFGVGDYDASRTLYIDPLIGSTFVGGTYGEGETRDQAFGVTTDGNGNIYVVGEAESASFPVTDGAYQTLKIPDGSSDAFVLKLDPDMTTVLAATYLGGDRGQSWVGYYKYYEGDDKAIGVTVADSGDVYVTGATTSIDFPTTPGAYNGNNWGDTSAIFITRFTNDLSTLLASTLLEETVMPAAPVDIALDSSGDVFVAGEKASMYFPTTAGAYETDGTGLWNSFVSKLDADLTTLLASTLLSGSGKDNIQDFTLDDSGNVYVTGHTTSNDYPVTSGAYQGTFNAGTSPNYNDAFVSVLDNDLVSLLASTYVGGTQSDMPTAITLDDAGDIYITGSGSSTDYPVTTGAYDTTMDSSWAAFVSRLDPGLTTLKASTFLEGASGSSAADIEYDPVSGDLIIGGGTSSKDFPTTAGAYMPVLSSASGAYLTRMSSTLTAPLLSSTFIYGSNYDYIKEMTLDSSGDVIFAGSTSSPNFPVTPTAFDTTYNGGTYARSNVIVTKLNPALSSLEASTFIGGDDLVVPATDYAGPIAVDGSGDVFITGKRYTVDFPTTTGTFASQDSDSYILKFDGTLSSLLTSAFLSGDIGAMAIDGSGNVYVAGDTDDMDHPTTPGAYEETKTVGGTVGFVTRFSNDLGAITASTYVGADCKDMVDTYDIALDDSNNVYITGKINRYSSAATPYPTTPGAYDTTPTSGTDAFVSCLDADLTTLVASTYLGGSEYERALAVDVDSAGNVFVGGYTASGNFPTTPGAHQTVHDDPGSLTYSDAFISKFSGELTTLTASTFLGGNSGDELHDLVVDSADRVYVTGSTNSYDFPTTPGAYNTGYIMGTKVFATRMNNGLSTVEASTFVGRAINGDLDRDLLSMGLDLSGNVYVAGGAFDDTFPTTPGAFDTSANGGGDAFLAKLDADLTLLDASTFIGGSGEESFVSLAVLPSGDAYVTGTTWSGDFPVSTGAYDEYIAGASDIFVFGIDMVLPNYPPAPDAGGPYTAEEGTSVTLDASGSTDSDDDPMEYRWDFGDDGVWDTAFSSDSTASHTWYEDQTATVRVEVTNGIFTESDTAQVTILNAPPVADAGGDITGDEGSAVLFSGSHTDPGTMDTHTYEWDFDYDGTTFHADATGNGVYNMWRDDHTGTVALRVTDDDGGWDIDTCQVTINNVAPTADAGLDRESEEPGHFFFTTTRIDPGSWDIVTMEWDFDYDDVTFDVDATGYGVWKTFYDDFDGTVALRATDDDGGWDLDTCHVLVTNVPPTAYAGSNKFVDEATSVTFTGSHSEATYLDTVTYEWDFEWDGVTFDTDAVGNGVSYTWYDDHNGAAALRVTDDDGGSDIDTCWVTVKNVAPTADAGGDRFSVEGTGITFTGSHTDPGVMDTHTYEWDFDYDGTNFYPEATGAEVTRTWWDDHVGVVALRVTDDDGGWDIDTCYVTVENAPPVADAGPDMYAYEGETLYFTAGYTDPGPLDTHMYYWDLDYDGAMFYADRTGYVVSYTWYDDHDGTVALRVMDDDGDWDQDTLEVHVMNLDPVADAGYGKYMLEVADCMFVGDHYDQGILDTHTYEWDFDYDGYMFDTDAVGQIAFNTWYDDFVGTVALRVTDDDGGWDIDTCQVIVFNVDPVILALPDQSGSEVATFTLSGVVHDEGPLDTHTYEWDLDYDGVTFDTDAVGNWYSHTWYDDFDGTVALRVTDDDGGWDIDTCQVAVANVAPEITSLTGTTEPVRLGTPASIEAVFTDPGALDTHTYSIDWGEFVTPGTADGLTISKEHYYASTGVYSIEVTVTDDDGGSDTAVYQEYVVVYDPEGGFVTGGGWIDSPEGAYTDDPALEGKASFGFVAKYKKGATTPMGNTEFWFEAGDLSFESVAYDWLVIAGPKAQYKGTGTINGEGVYGFMLTATDSDVPGGGDVDRLRIKIWDKVTGGTVYDNNLGSTDDTAPSTALGGGQIKVHKG